MILNLIQIAISVLLIASILLQKQSAGLGSSFGGGGNVFGQRRGAQKQLFIASIVLAVLFVGSALLRLII